MYNFFQVKPKKDNDAKEKRSVILHLDTVTLYIAVSSANDL